MPSHLSKASKFLSSAFTLRLAPNPAKYRCSVKLSTMSNGGGAVRFPLSASSTLVIQKGDITKWFIDGSTDAIVNPANERMLGGGGADGAIHRAAGPDLLQACYSVPEVRPGVRCPTGEARITPGFKLPASHVIHTVGPIYRSDSNPEVYLSAAYRLLSVSCCCFFGSLICYS
ncbi:PREDICTED: O-acetyl-ADP-ribose deacetylase [Prunus dulcis]|uniref:PREDICTED: O-acetyl-ADP-ribose deacetylase n=1 Tax=Prunus dulcis TaxID=3755 RepID=A0A5E4ETQ5_PRUDU|nr:PREDICTED: O-acetyl-ADP-ribose deacetylase [Prunus dulcis]